MTFRDQEETPEYVPGQHYSPMQLEMMADSLLRQDGRRELCRECIDQGRDIPYGRMTGNCRHEYVEDEYGDRYVEDGHWLEVELPELECVHGHCWFFGEGKAKGLRGENSVLLEEHLATRTRREIFNKNGYPESELYSGSFHRSHPQGIKESWHDED